MSIALPLARAHGRHCAASRATRRSWRRRLGDLVRRLDTAKPLPKDWPPGGRMVHGQWL